MCWVEELYEKRCLTTKGPLTAVRIEEPDELILVPADDYTFYATTTT